MNVPSGYSEIGMIGFTDRGDYASNATYVKNDLVHYSGGLWRCLIDDTRGIEPHESLNWTIFVSQPESAAESLIAPIEHDAGASERAYAVGKRFILNDTMYKATRAISVGDELVEGTNYELADDVSTQLDSKANKTEAFLTNETTENALADADTVPFYDASASSKRKTTWSNIVSKIKASVSKSDVGLGNVPNVSTNDQTPTFSQASTRANIASGEKLSTIFGKIMKVIADLKAVAFTGAYSDLSGKPTKLSQFDNDSQYLKFIGFFPNGTSMNDQPDGIYQITPSNLPTELANVESIGAYGQLFNQKQGYTHTTYVDVYGRTLTWRSYDSKWVNNYSSDYTPSWNDIRSKPSAFTPTSHASTGTGYGVGNADNYGHVKLSDNYKNNLGAAASGLGASQSALFALGTWHLYANIVTCTISNKNSNVSVASNSFHGGIFNAMTVHLRFSINVTSKIDHNTRLFTIWLSQYIYNYGGYSQILYAQNTESVVGQIDFRGADGNVNTLDCYSAGGVNPGDYINIDVIFIRMPKFTTSGE